LMQIRSRGEVEDNPEESLFIKSSMGNDEIIAARQPSDSQIRRGMQLKGKFRLPRPGCQTHIADPERGRFTNLRAAEDTDAFSGCPKL